MATIRQEQIAELVKRNMSYVLQSSGSYIYGDALVTVTTVKMTSDLGLARIYCSVYNTENKQAVILMMGEEIVRLRQELARRLRKQMRRIPDIEFYLDDTLDEMYRLNALFDKLHEENQMGSKDDKEVHPSS